MSASEAASNGSVLQRKLSLSKVVDPATFGELVRDFAELYRIGVKVFDEKGAKLADVKIGNGDFCGYVFSFDAGRRCCTQTVAKAKDGALSPTEGGIVALPCFTGLRYLILPIEWDGDPLGRVIFGPFAPDTLKSLPESLTGIAPKLDVSVAWNHLGKIRRAPESLVEKLLAHFSRILASLISVGQKSHLTAQLHIETTLESHHELSRRLAELEEAHAQLRELDRLKSSFLAIVSHELRTPLTSIIGYSEMLAEGLAGPVSDEQGEYLRTILDKGDTLLRLISTLLDLTQIEAGRMRLSFEPVDLPELLASSASSVRPQALKKELALEVKVPAEPPPRPSGDRDKLKQVVTNLLANAVKFTPPKGRVTVRMESFGRQPELDAEGYRISVEDTGPGISPDQQEKIFQSFYQVDASSTREHGGAGLGLAIAKAYVVGHGGKILVESQPKEGSRFTVVLPARPPASSSASVPGTPEEIPDRF